MSAPAIVRVAIDNPDDVTGPPAFDGTLDEAGKQLAPGTYDAVAAYDDGTEEDVSLLIAETKDNAAAKAGTLLASVFKDGMTASGVGPHLACWQVNKITAALVALGQPEAAATLLVGHASEDSADDFDDVDHLAVKAIACWADAVAYAYALVIAG